MVSDSLDSLTSRQQRRDGRMAYLRHGSADIRVRPLAGYGSDPYDVRIKYDVPKAHERLRCRAVIARLTLEKA